MGRLLLSDVIISFVLLYYLLLLKLSFVPEVIAWLPLGQTAASIIKAKHLLQTSLIRFFTCTPMICYSDSFVFSFIAYPYFIQFKHYSIRQLVDASNAKTSTH